MTHDLLHYTHGGGELYPKPKRKLYARHQARFDYHGELDREEDSADCYEPIKAVSLG